LRTGDSETVGIKYLRFNIYPLAYPAVIAHNNLYATKETSMHILIVCFVIILAVYCFGLRNLFSAGMIGCMLIVALGFGAAIIGGCEKFSEANRISEIERNTPNDNNNE
jgi:hypothetical protein